MFANGTLAATSRTAVPGADCRLDCRGGFVFAIENGKVEEKPVTPGNKERGIGLCGNSRRA